jgi:hypothetical protein
VALPSFGGAPQIEAEVEASEVRAGVGEQAFVAVLLPLTPGTTIELSTGGWSPVSARAPLPRVPSGNLVSAFDWRSAPPPGEGRVIFGAIAAVALPHSGRGNVAPAVPYARPSGEPAARLGGAARVVGGARGHFVAVTFDPVVWPYRADRPPLVLGRGFHLLTRRCDAEGSLLIEPWQGGAIPISAIPERPDALDVDFERPNPGCPLETRRQLASVAQQAAWLGDDKVAVLAAPHTLVVRDTRTKDERKVALPAEAGVVRRLHGTADASALFLVTEREDTFRLIRLRGGATGAPVPAPWTDPACGPGEAGPVREPANTPAPSMGCAALALDEVAQGIEAPPLVNPDGSAAAFVREGSARLLALRTGVETNLGPVGAPVAMSPDGAAIVAELPGGAGRRFVRVDASAAVAPLPRVPSAPLAIVWGASGPAAIVRDGESLLLRDLTSGHERTLWRRGDWAAAPVVPSASGTHLFAWTGACVRLGAGGRCTLGRHDLFRLDLRRDEVTFAGRASVPALLAPSSTGRQVLFVEETHPHAQPSFSTYVVDLEPRGASAVQGTGSNR